MPVFLCGDWVLDMSEDCITRWVVDTEMQWLMFCYDEIENKNYDLFSMYCFVYFAMRGSSENHRLELEKVPETVEFATHFHDTIS